MNAGMSLSGRGEEAVRRESGAGRGGGACAEIGLGARLGRLEMRAGGTEAVGRLRLELRLGGEVGEVVVEEEEDRVGDAEAGVQDGDAEAGSELQRSFATVRVSSARSAGSIGISLGVGAAASWIYAKGRHAPVVSEGSLGYRDSYGCRLAKSGSCAPRVA